LRREDGGAQRASAGLTASQATFATAAFSLGHNVTSKEEVDQVMARAEAAGARIVDPAHDRVWGSSSGYFQDLDGQIARNPDLAGLVSLRTPLLARA
jgi:uncharacterized glyoxalase superfamily protein PhnB